MLKCDSAIKGGSVSINTAAAFLLRVYFVFNASNFCFNSARAFSISS